MQKISFNQMISMLIDRSERGEFSTIGFYKTNGEYREKQLLYGAPRTNERKRVISTITKKGQPKSEIKQGKIPFTEIGTNTLITPFSRLIVSFENKEVWH